MPTKSVSLAKEFIDGVPVGARFGTGLLTAAGALLLALVWSAPLHAAVTDLRVSSNNRFLETTAGAPFFYLADTAWELFHRTTREDADVYFANRASKGFNTIQCVLLAEVNGLAVASSYGYLPLSDNNPETPAVVDGANNDYWDHCDYIVNKAEELGLHLALLPTWGDKVDLMWGPGPVIFTSESKAYAYGRFLGDRYKNKRHIIWTLGGDRGPSAEWVWNAMAEGIADGVNGENNLNGSADYSTTTITFHPMGGRSSSESFQNSTWLDFNSYQSGHSAANLGTIYSIGQSDYAKSPVKPTINTEPNYENHAINWSAVNGYFGAYDVRKSFYWSVFSGCAGYTYGCHSMWQLYAPGRNPVGTPLGYWYDELNLEGVSQLIHGRNLILSRPYLSRVPDNTLINGTNSGADAMSATKDSGGNYAFVYFPKETTSKLVYASKLTGTTINAWWYNPRDGKCYTQEGVETTSPFSMFSKQNMTFDPPGSSTTSDWVLVLDNSAEPYTAPGTTASLRIVTVGDSITQGDSSHFTFRYYLWKNLIDAGISFDLVGSQAFNAGGNPAWPVYAGRTFDPNHEGHWGWRADEIAAQLPGWLAGYTPDIALVHIGSNDAFQSQSNAGTLAEIAQIIDQLRADNPNVIVLLAKIIPAADAGLNSRVRSLNDQIPAFATQKSTAESPVVVVDQFTGFAPVSETYDGVHPNTDGEEKIAAVWSQAIQAVVGRPRIPAVPAAPVTVTSDARVTLSWTVVSGATGYNVKRATVDGGPYTTLATNVVANTYADSGLTNGTAYYYVISAVNTTGESANSAQVTAIPAPNVRPPAPWSEVEIGSPGTAGSATYANGVFVIKGAGADIWDSWDSFHFVEQAVTGDCDIRAQVVSQGNTDAWAKAGVMIREKSEAGSKYAMVAVTPGNGFRFQSRSTPWGTSIDVPGGTLHATPNNWVRLTRIGDLLTGYKSADGTFWTVLTSVTIPMNPSILIGMPVCSHNANALSASTFDHVRAADTRTDTSADGTPDLWDIAHGLDPSIANHPDDPDADGIPNLMEFALDLDPTFPDHAGMPAADAQSGFLTLTVDRNPGAENLNYQIEVSDDLITWHTGGADLTILEDTSNRLIARDNTPLAGVARRFMRLKVSPLKSR